MIRIALIVSSHKSIKHSLTRLTVTTLAALLVFWPSLSQVEAVSGDLDTSFGNGGKVITDFHGLSNSATDLIIQPDGKIVAAGDAFNLFGELNNFAVARYNADGTADHFFGEGSKVSINIRNRDHLTAAALQPDDKIVLVGRSETGMGKPIYSYTRLNADGSRDPAFQTIGPEFSFINDVAVQSDGKIVFAGSELFCPSGTTCTTQQLVIRRLLPDGSKDTGFGEGGAVINRSFSSASQVAIQPDGKIVVAAGKHILRYKPNGILDNKFGSNGVAAIDSPDFDSIAAIALQLDGKIVVAGNANFINAFPRPAASDFALLRYNGNGRLDKSFGDGGMVVTDFGASDVARGVAVAPDGAIVVAGSTVGNNTGLDFALACYNRDGSADSEAGPEGKVVTDFYGDNDEAYTVAFQNDEVVAAGYATNGSLRYFALARYGGGDAEFDLCLQDDENGNLLQLNSETGEYLFSNCSGFTLGGTGTLLKKGNTITLSDSRADRKVEAQIKTPAKKGSATIQTASPSKRFTINDKKMTDNTCSCE